MNSVVSSSVSIISADKAPSGSIKEGSEVFVRVLGREHSGRYTVTFAGQRFSVASRRPLETGTAFKAVVRVHRGQVLLEPLVRDRVETQNRYGITRFSSFTADKTGSLSSLLYELGLPADNISLRLLSFFQESGIRFNKHSALKARLLAKRFPGREEAAAEAALLLTEKGINPDEASVAEITGLFYGERHKDGPPERETSDSAAVQSGETASVIESLYMDAERCLSLPAGLLSFVNQYKTGDRHWVFLPFEYKNGDLLLNGVIRLLFSLGQKKTEKIVISAFSATKDYFFVIYCISPAVFPHKKIAAVDFCINPAPALPCIKDFERFLHGVLPPDSTVQYRPELFDTDGSAFSRLEEQA